MAKNEKFTLEYVKNYFKEQGCELLENEYHNMFHSMQYKCSCGFVSKINFTKVKEKDYLIEGSNTKCKDITWKLNVKKPK